ncbi:hypothetical protein B0H14DRAFT_2629226 [Mycena olivaceomarginata]|nr:hypothetical protein B0H14DRAFT_2629226 [Mycena olivaceomarginata]
MVEIQVSGVKARASTNPAHLLKNNVKNRKGSGTGLEILSNYRRIWHQKSLMPDEVCLAKERITTDEPQCCYTLFTKDSDTVKAREVASRWTEPEPEADADTDSPDTNYTTKVTAASSSSETIDADNDKKPAKRRRLTERRSASGKNALLDLMKEENKCHAEYDNCIANSLDTFMKDSREQKAEFASLLRDFISSEYNN